jgi:hypothetical protein
MNLLDVRTVMFGHLVSDFLCALVIILLWHQNRSRYAGILFWSLDLAFQALSVVLIMLRGGIPDWLSMVLSNTLVIAGALLGLIGLQRFVGQRSSQLPNYVVLAAFAIVQAYFAFVKPNLAMRNINISMGLLIVCLQCAWLLLRRVRPDVRRMARCRAWVGSTPPEPSWQSSLRRASWH